MVRDYEYPIRVTFDYVPAHVKHPLVLHFSEKEFVSLGNFCNHFDEPDYADSLSCYDYRHLFNCLNRIFNACKIIANTAEECCAQRRSK